MAGGREREKKRRREFLLDAAVNVVLLDDDGGNRGGGGGIGGATAFAEWDALASQNAFFTGAGLGNFTGTDFTVEWFARISGAFSGSSFSIGGGFPSDEINCQVSIDNHPSGQAHMFGLVTTGGGSSSFDVNDPNHIDYRNVKIHVALTYDGGTLRGFVAGKQVGSVGTARTFSFVNKSITIAAGVDVVAGPTRESRARAFAFSNVCRYAADFSPPNANQDMPTDASTLYYWRVDEGTGLLALATIGGISLTHSGTGPTNPWGVW